MKAYPVTIDDMLTLGVVQGGSAVFFALAGTCGGFWVSVTQSIAFAEGVDPAKVAYWKGLGDAAFYGSIVSVVLGLALIGLNGLKLWRIYRDTEH